MTKKTGIFIYFSTQLTKLKIFKWLILQLIKLYYLIFSQFITYYTAYPNGTKYVPYS